MKISKEQGVSLINIILSLLIVIACGVIVYLIKVDNASPGIELAENIEIKYNPNGNTNTNIQNEIVTNISLSNEIAYGGEKTTTQDPPPQQVPVQELDAYRYYYYNQLDDKAKSMYAIILNNVDSLKDGYQPIEISTGTENVNVNFQACWDAFTMDKPEIFYVDTKKVSLVTHSTKSILGTKYSLVVQPQSGANYFLDCWSNNTQVQSAINEVETEVNKIVNEASGYSNLYDRIKYVHDYIVENSEYDRTNDINNSDIYGIFLKGKAVCEGYAKAFKIIMDRLGIPCVVVCGNGYSDDGNSEFHAWNYVMMEDGNWYAVDTTWDDPIIIGNGKISDQAKHRYFLVGASNFNSSHVEDGDVSGTGQNFKYPQISSSNYKR